MSTVAMCDDSCEQSVCSAAAIVIARASNPASGPCKAEAIDGEIFSTVRVRSALSEPVYEHSPDYKRAEAGQQSAA